MHPIRGQAATVFLLLAGATAGAHHSVLNYDGKTEITITGTVTKARFGFPHSVYRIDVVNGDGSVTEWTLSTEDPRDAERLGFAQEIRSIRAGDAITVTGWPHKFNEREIRGHKLHFPDGRVVMMRRGNYIWPKDILRLDRLVQHPDEIGPGIPAGDQDMPAAERVLAWIAEGDHVARAAREVSLERPRLVGIRGADGVEFPGVDELLACHTRREEFTMTVDPAELGETGRGVLASGAAYVSEYNRVLSRWWEQERSSCD
ncbi:MAG: DUF6152 family protein [Gammaproteobacteria bacterium]|nr:DUF6152 family protein [Gammaproteobacteria bacterium]MDH4253611.1 DUF6152 family protein [Gammaproteobacteria bacterium]MDH5310374.1 DUF6152 family protein [Gammaproteobacteria bacterium]